MRLPQGKKQGCHQIWGDKSDKTSADMNRKGKPLEVWGMAQSQRLFWKFLDSGLQTSAFPLPNNNPAWASGVPEPNEFEFRKSLELIRKGLVFVCLVSLFLVSSPNIPIYSKILKVLLFTGFCHSSGRNAKKKLHMILDPEWLALQVGKQEMHTSKSE